MHIKYQIPTGSQRVEYDCIHTHTVIKEPKEFQGPSLWPGWSAPPSTSLMTGLKTAGEEKPALIHNFSYTACFLMSSLACSVRTLFK